MSLAQIFMPIRHPEIAGQAEVFAVLRPASPEPGASRDSRVEAIPVTNTPPPGPQSTKEEGWLALLELVFETTGWPDAEE